MGKRQTPSDLNNLNRNISRNMGNKSKAIGSLTYKRDVCGLTVVDSLFSINPETRQFRENIDSSERLEVVDKDIGDP